MKFCPLEILKIRTYGLHVSGFAVVSVLLGMLFANSLVMSTVVNLRSWIVGTKAPLMIVAWKAAHVTIALLLRVLSRNWLLTALLDLRFKLGDFSL